jgi:predicted dehydrogenase
MFDVLVVGCGRMAGNTDPPRLDSYGRAIQDSKNFRMAMGVDASWETARRFGERYGCAFDVHLGRAIDEVAPDLVIVASPDADHAPALKVVLGHPLCPKAVIVEKPVCISSAQLTEISVLVADTNAEVGVNHTRRLDPRFRSLRDAIVRNDYGLLTKARAVYYGGWLHNGIHSLDTICYLFGEAPSWQRVFGRLPGRFPEDPSWSLVGHLPGQGATVEIEAVDEGHYQIFEFDLRFERGRVRIDNFDRSFATYRVVVNDCDEHVLVADDAMAQETNGSATVRLLSLVALRLLGQASEQLNDITLKSVMTTMDSLLKGAKVGQEG